MRVKSLGVIGISILGFAAAGSYGTIVYTVGSVASLDPGGNPVNAGTPPVIDAASNSTLTDGETFANFTTDVAAAYANNTGGVINFEETDESGNYNTGTAPNTAPTPAFSWPSQTTAANGVTLGNGQNNAVQVNYGASQPTGTVPYANGGASNTSQLAAGANNIVFWRDLYTTGGGVPGATSSTLRLNLIAGSGGTGNSTQTITTDGFDANNGLNNSAVTGVTPASGNGYMGITSDGTPVVLDFSSDPLSAFGITVLQRNSARPLQVDLTLADDTVIKSSTEANAGSGAVGTGPDIFYGFNLTSADLATHGGIVYATFDAANTDRYDDLAFIVAPVPEPTSISLLGLGGLALLRRRRRA